MYHLPPSLNFAIRKTVEQNPKRARLKCSLAIPPPLTLLLAIIGFFTFLTEPDAKGIRNGKFHVLPPFTRSKFLRLLYVLSGKGIASTSGEVA